MRALAQGDAALRPWEIERMTVPQIAALYSDGEGRELTLDQAVEVARRQRERMRREREERERQEREDD